MTTLFIINWLALLLSFFVVGCILGALFSPSFRKTFTRAATKGVKLSRTLINPIIRGGSHPWQAEAVFNPSPTTGRS